MRIVVTGGSGFIGRNTVAQLRARGDEVVVADLLPYPDPAVEWVEGDLRDPAVVERAVAAGTDAVVHLAAITSVLLSAKDPHAAFQTNVDATELLLERCRTIGVQRFVFSSSNAVAGDVGTGVIDERVVPHPLTPYGATKAAAEMLFWAYAASYGMTTVALRFTNVYGPEMDQKDSVIAWLMKCALDGGTIQIYGDGEQLRDYLYVGDAVAAIELGLSLDHAETLTIGARRSVSMNELYETACQVTGVQIPREHVTAKPGEMPAVVVDTGHAGELGFDAGTDLVEGLTATWKDFLTKAGR